MNGFRTFLALCILSCILTVIGMAIQQPILFGASVLLLISAFIEGSSLAGDKFNETVRRLNKVESTQDLDRLAVDFAKSTSENTVKMIQELEKDTSGSDRETTKKVVELMGQLAKLERRVAGLEEKGEDPRF